MASDHILASQASLGLHELIVHISPELDDGSDIKAIKKPSPDVEMTSSLLFTKTFADINLGIDFGINSEPIQWK